VLVECHLDRAVFGTDSHHRRPLGGVGAGDRAGVEDANPFVDGVFDDVGVAADADDSVAGVVPATRSSRVRDRVGSLLAAENEPRLALDRRVERGELAVVGRFHRRRDGGRVDGRSDGIV